MAKVRWEEMFPDELLGVIREHPVCYMAYGLAEPHGAYGALGLDWLKAYSLCEKAAQTYGGVLALPMICEDGAQDYTLAVGVCGFEGPSDASIDLDLVGDLLPGPICVRQVVNELVSFDINVIQLGATEVVLELIRIETLYEDSTLPEGIDLSTLTPGQTYQLEITVTDGNTPEVSDRKDFLHQGETVIKFLSP